VRSLDGTDLFDEDGGIGKVDYDDLPIDVIDYTGFSGVFSMSCKFFKGSRTL